MDTYDMEVECGMYCQGGSVKGVLEPYGYGSWVKVEDAESLTAERDRLSAENAKLQSELAAEVAENVRLRTREVGDEVGNLLQEVADLKNELARVKAESLRVVPMIEDRPPFNMNTIVRHIVIDGKIFRLERWEANDGLGA